DISEMASLARELGLPQAAVRQLPHLPRGCAVWQVGSRIRIVQNVISDYERDLALTDAAMAEA
ncbi:hypothetical protein, partial [Rhizobium leguminosarum]|uniref:hypothetical protein n=1 Tax=Rhizobium leguminosarum TaxID=384 RepID=UPI003F9D16AD